MSDDEIRKQKMEALLEMSEAQLEENRIGFRAWKLSEKFLKAAELLRGMDYEGASTRPEAFDDVAALELPDAKELRLFAAQARASRERWLDATATKRKLGLV